MQAPGDCNCGGGRCAILCGCIFPRMRVQCSPPLHLARRWFRGTLSPLLQRAGVRDKHRAWNPSQQWKSIIAEKYFFCVKPKLAQILVSNSAFPEGCAPAPPMDIFSCFFSWAIPGSANTMGGNPSPAVIVMNAPLAGFAGKGRQPRLERRFFRSQSLPFPLPSQGRSSRALGPGFPQQPHGATEGSPSYRATAPHLTAWAPALPTEVQALSQLVVQQVIQQLWGSHHPPPCCPPTCPPVPVTLHTGWAADRGFVSTMPPSPWLSTMPPPPWLCQPCHLLPDCQPCHLLPDCDSHAPVCVISLPSMGSGAALADSSMQSQASATVVPGGLHPNMDAFPPFLVCSGLFYFDAEHALRCVVSRQQYAVPGVWNCGVGRPASQRGCIPAVCSGLCYFTAEHMVWCSISGKQIQSLASATAVSGGLHPYIDTFLPSASAVSTCPLFRGTLSPLLQQGCVSVSQAQSLKFVVEMKIDITVK